LSRECLHCGEENPDSDAVCKNCGSALLSSVTSENSQNEHSKTAVLRMTDLKSGKEINISNNCVIGRSGNVETEFFAGDKFISEYHCKVFLENGEYKIEHLPTATNPTKINNVPLVRTMRNPIRNGDYLTIADKTFEISICHDEICDDAIQGIPLSVNSDSVNNNSGSKTIYVIVCPKCGSEYEVDNIGGRINECNHCDDYDKHEISKIGAKVKYAD